MASSSVLTVGHGQQYSTIAAAVAAAQPGDTIDVQAGTYTNDFVNVYKDITLQAVGGVVKLVATVSPPNRKAIIDEGGKGVSVTINGFDISGAKVGDANGAAIRYEGGKLTLNNDYLHNNQDGLLGAADAAGSITINNSEVAFNGTGDGHTHNLYIGDIANFTLSNSYIHDANVGHEVKSRAENNTIVNSRIFDNNATASYSIDLPNGGNATISNDIIEQGRNSENQTIIAYGEEGSLHGGTNVLIANNTIVNDKGSVVGVWNRTTHAVTLQNNSVYGLTSGNLTSGPASVSGTTSLASRPALDTSSHWAPGNNPPPPPPPPSGPPPVTSGNGSDSLVLSMSGDAAQGDAQFTVSVDGKQVGGTFTTTARHGSGETQTFTLKGDWAPGNHGVVVWFQNSAAGRNLYVNSVTYDGANTGQSFAFVGRGGPRGFHVTDKTVGPGGAASTQASAVAASPAMQFLYPAQGSGGAVSGNAGETGAVSLAVSSQDAVPGLTSGSAATLDLASASSPPAMGGGNSFDLTQATPVSVGTSQLWSA